MINEISQLFTAYVADYGYLIAFAISFLENSIFLGLLVPGDTVAILSGFYSGQGAISFPIALFILIIGGVLGDNVGFLLGKYKGREWLTKMGPKIGFKKDKINRADIFWQRHGEKAIVIGDFTSYVRTFVPFFAGTSGMKQKHFFIWDLFAVSAHALILIILGYYFGDRWQEIRNTFGIIGILFFVAFLIFIYNFFIKKGAKKIENK